MKLATTDIFKRICYNNSDLITLNDEQLKDLQSKILIMANDIITICEENNLSYHLTGGTALGAVRHHGFIPWDDDLDIDIERKDYNKLLEIIKEKYQDKYFIHNQYNKDGFSTVATNIRMKNTIVRGCNDFSNKECGVGIDIAIIENTFENAFLRKLHGVLSLGLGFIASCRKFSKNRKYLLDLVKEDKEAKKIFYKKIVIGTLFSFLTPRRWNIIYDKCNSICKNSNSKFVSVPNGRKHFFKEMYLRKDFCEYERCDFEGNNWKIPKEYDKYLTHMYGDYMKIPDERNREKHVVLEFKLD